MKSGNASQHVRPITKLFRTLADFCGQFWGLSWQWISKRKIFRSSLANRLIYQQDGHLSLRREGARNIPLDSVLIWPYLAICTKRAVVKWSSRSLAESAYWLNSVKKNCDVHATFCSTPHFKYMTFSVIYCESKRLCWLINLIILCKLRWPFLMTKSSPSTSWGLASLFNRSVSPLDLSKAFDHIDHNILVCKLLKWPLDLHTTNEVCWRN